MKKTIVLLVLVVILAGCGDYMRTDEAGSSPALQTVAKLRQANAVSAPVNPYSPLIELGLGLATVVLGGSYAVQRKKLGVVGKKYASHKEAVANIMYGMTAEQEAQLYKEIGILRKKQGL